MKAVKLALATMTLLTCSANAGTKVYVTPLNTNYPNNFYFILGWYDETSMSFVHQSILLLPKDNSITSTNVAIAACKTFIYSEATSLGYTITDGDIIANWSIDGVPAPRSFTFNASRSLVTGTGATGFQVSSSQDALVNYSVTVATTATIAGNALGTVVLEVAPTNSATPSDWKEVGRITNGQALSLAVALQSVQTTAGVLTGVVPSGYYVKIRTISVTGSPTFTYNSGMETLL